MHTNALSRVTAHLALGTSRLAESFTEESFYAISSSKWVK